MLPVIAIVGRPNVGKSTLFNCLTKSRDALVLDMPGVTRDRAYGEAQIDSRRALLVDTGGLTDKTEGVESVMAEQARQAVAESDLVLFLVDARAGLLPEDQSIADFLRRQHKPVQLVVNKSDGLEPATVGIEFFQLGLGEPVNIAASHRRGINMLTQKLLPLLGPVAEPVESGEDGAKNLAATKVALIGRPNVGKSTLINRILGEQRVVVYDMPGTTRDSISVAFTRFDQEYIFIDTAGVRRQGRIKETVEKFSVIKAMQAIDSAHVVIVVVDAKEALTDQDLHLIGSVVQAGRGLVIAINKWDNLSPDQKQKIRNEISRKLEFVHDYVDIHFISALHGTGVGNLFDSIIVARTSAYIDIAPRRLTEVINDATEEHQPPMARGRRIKLRYAHMGGHNPPRIVIHGSQAESLPAAYQRFLIHRLRKTFNLRGTPIHLELKSGQNPYAGKKNKLTKRQQEKRKRLYRHVKGKK